jgi:hypothetical protein
VTDSFSVSISEQGLISWTRTSLTAFKPLVATPVQIASLLLIMQGSIIQFRLIPDTPIIKKADHMPLYAFTVTIQLLTDFFAAFLCFICVGPSSASTISQRLTELRTELRTRMLSKGRQKRQGRQQLSRAQRFTPFVIGVIFGLTRLPLVSLFPFTFCDCITGVCWSFMWWRCIGEFYADKSPIHRAILRCS